MPALEMTWASHASCSQHYGNTSFQVYPISFSIPRNLIMDVHEHSSKSRVLASIIPGRFDTYIYPDQASYYGGYASSMFAATYKKGGWDCLRHYEILAAGCIPYMPDAAKIPNGTMFRWPKRMMLSILELKGLNHRKIQTAIEGTTIPNASSADLLNYGEFDFKTYHDNRRDLHDHLLKYFTTQAMGQYLLSFSSRKVANILFVGAPTSETHFPDYQAETLFHGLRSLFAEQVLDFPKRPWMYSNAYDSRETVYGKGYTYAFHLQDLSVNREDIEGRVSAHEFSHVIFGIMHHGRHWLIDEVARHYAVEEVFFVDGSDVGAQETDEIFHSLCGVIGLCFRRELVCTD